MKTSLHFLQWLHEYIDQIWQQFHIGITFNDTQSLKGNSGAEKKKQLNWFVGWVFIVVFSNISYQYYFSVALLCLVNFMYEDEKVVEFSGSISSSLYISVLNITCLLYGWEKVSTWYLLNAPVCSNKIFWALGIWMSVKLRQRSEADLWSPFVVSGCFGYFRLGSWDILRQRFRLFLVRYRWAT